MANVPGPKSKSQVPCREPELLHVHMPSSPRARRATAPPGPGVAFYLSSRCVMSCVRNPASPLSCFLDVSFPVRRLPVSCRPARYARGGRAFGLPDPLTTASLPPIKIYSSGAPVHNLVGPNPGLALELQQQGRAKRLPSIPLPPVPLFKL